MIDSLQRARLGVFLAFALLAICGPSLSAQQDDALLQQAEELFVKENFVEAAKLFRQILEKDGQDFNANFKLGLCELTQKNYGDAVVMLTAAAESESDLMHEVYFYRGFSYFRLKKSEQALEDYGKALEIKPDYLDAFNNRAQVFEQVNNPGAAIADYQSALKIDSTNPGLWYNVGRLFALVEKCPEAITAFNTALKFEPQYGQALLLRGNCHLLIKRLDKATEDFEALVALVPDNAEAIAKLGYCQVLSGNTDEGCANIKRALEAGYAPAAQMRGSQCD